METDVLVLGAGPAGSSTAYFLAEEGVRVILADAQTFPREKICGDGVTPAGVRVLSRMGVLDGTEDQKGRYRPFRGVRIFASDGTDVRLHYPHHSKGGGPRHGYVIPRYDLDYQIVNRAAAAGAEFMPGFRAVEPLYDAGQVVGYRGRYHGRSMRVRAKLVVVATGARLHTVQALGLCPSPATTELAMRGYFVLDGEVEAHAYLEIHLERDLLPYYGWLFPVNDRTVNVGVGADRGGQGEGRLRATFREFVRRNPRMRERLSGAVLKEPPRGWPMRSEFLTRRTYADGLLAVGEAAGLVDPLTGEGIAFALQGGELAAAAASEALCAGDFSAGKLSSYGLALSRHFAPYFSYAQRLRSLLSNPELADTLVALAIRAKETRAQGWAPGPLASLLRFAVERRRVLGAAPYLAYRLLRTRSRSIEA